MFDYYVLNDEKHKGLLIRQNRETMDEAYYSVAFSQWTPCQLLVNYFLLESDVFNQYELLTEEEAIVYISRLMFMKFYDDGFAYPNEQ
ncbi:MAG: hypothetical protein LBM95_03970 [Lactobacillales bacterium]|jgi:hypothetical protein|nr:hypothetical protein [Lactobacillales bacterium]